MSRSLRTIPAGALAACAVVLLTAPHTEAVANRAGRPDATAPRPAASARPHPPGVADRSPAPSGAPHAAAETDTDADDPASAAVVEGVPAVGSPGWPAPVAPPAEPLIDSEVWQPAGATQDQALDGTHARAVGRPASQVGAPVLPVLTFGAGLTCLGLGIAFFALRLRRG